MKNVITIRLDDELERLINRVSRKLKRNKSELIRESIRRQLLIYEFENLREQSIPYAEKQGYLTDEDIFREIS